MASVPEADVSNSESKNRFLTVRDVAELMSVPKSTVYGLARQKRIAGLIRFGRHIRFDRDLLECWLDDGGETPRDADG